MMPCHVVVLTHSVSLSLPPSLSPSLPLARSFARALTLCLSFSLSLIHTQSNTRTHAGTANGAFRIGEVTFCTALLALEKPRWYVSLLVSVSLCRRA